MQIGGVWVDATGNILKRQLLTHTRGRQDQDASTDPSTLRPLLNNTNGQFSPDNPLGPYYEQFGRNSPFRVSIAAGAPALDLPGNTLAVATTPDTAALDIVGDIDVRVDATLANWTTYTGILDTTQLVGKLSLAAGTKSWFLGTRSGAAYFEWSADGSAALSASSTVPLPITASGRMALRVTLDVDNGAAGRTITFWTAPSGTAGPWTQLGTPVVQSGTTSIFNSATALRVGRATDVGFTQPIGRVHRVEVRSGIGGTVVANPDFAVQAVGAGSFADGAGRTWTVTSPAAVSNRHTRLSHELAAYPTEWHPSGAHAWVDATTAGILRRLRRGDHALDSTLRRRIPSGSPIAYWPMEDGPNSSQFSSPILRCRPMTTSGMDLASADSLAGSQALPVVRAGALYSGSVPSFFGGPPTEWHTEFVFFLPTSGPATARTVLQWNSTGTVKRWRLMLKTNGTEIYGYDADDNVVTSSLLGGMDSIFNTWTRWELSAVQNGGNVDWHVAFIPIGGSGGAVDTSYAGSVGRITGHTSNTGGVHADLEGLAIGHISVFATANTSIYNNADVAFTGETAGMRMMRLASEEGVPLTVCGVVAEQTLVGPQRPDAVLDLLQEAADADGGILYEDRDRPALRYRDRRGMYNQRPALVLDYNAPGLAPPLKPTGDDDATVNDVTVERVGGSSARAFLEEGKLSIQAPPNGVGTGYDTSVPLNLHSDEQTEPIAYWRMWLGTYEGRRYPQVHVMVHKAPGLVDQILAVDVGDKIVIRNPPIWVAPGDVELIVQGYEETFDEFAWDITFNCTPGKPWNVAVVDDPARGLTGSHVGGNNSVLATALNATDTVVPLLTTDGPVWWHGVKDTPYDWRVSGEDMTLTAPGSLLNANPFFTTDTTGWATQNCTFTRVTDVVCHRPTAVASLRITPDGSTGNANAIGVVTAAGSITPGASYTASMWVYSPGGYTDIRPIINWHDAGTAYLSTSSGSTAMPVPAGQWTYLEQVFTAPASASRASMLPSERDTPAAGDVYYVWAARVTRTKASWLYDNFGRTTVNGWGVSDAGLTWNTVGGGTAADYAVGSGYGSQVLATVDTTRRTAVTAIHPDADVFCDIAASALATGDSLFGAVTARMLDASNMYMCRVEFTASNTIIVTIRKQVAGVQTQLGSTYTVPVTHVAGTFIRLRFQVVGSTLRAKAWLASGVEPFVWQITASDTAITAANQIGTRSVRVATNTNAATVAIRYTNLDVINQQLFTVARGANGITKAQLAGTGVRVARPAIVPL
ncbi:carbohydrate binding domain-containing protein [Streptomyces sp. NPDC058614]|uniref:carbohydrate binding domain-containing protein n=1 Tax=Streptomyces sp. NPDC058614 TaxID=3346557 RepID=UPI0036614CAA